MVSKQNPKINKKRWYRIPKIAMWLFPHRIWIGTDKNVYLTFDDGPHPEITPWLLDELKKNKIHATFFWLGSQVEKYPDLLKRAREEGHVVGHHGYFHESGRKLIFQDFKKNFDQSKEMVKSELYRPPYGELKKRQAKYAIRNGEIVMWSWMSYDFDSTLTPQHILALAEKQIRNKDILVFHENEKTIHRIKEIIPQIIQIVHKKGLDFSIIKTTEK